MRSFRQSNQRKNTQRHEQLGYTPLEPRQLLAVTAVFDTNTGQLSIDLNDNSDSATIDIVDSNMTVNGSADLDPAPGVQSVPFGDVIDFDIQGDATKAQQQVFFAGDFSTVAGGQIQNIDIQDVNQVIFSGQYSLQSNLTIGLVNTEGGVLDGDSAALTVGGITDIDSRNNAIRLDGTANDFVGPVRINTGGLNSIAVLTDINDISFSGVTTTGNWEVTAGGDISDLPGTVIDVGRDGILSSNTITLGDNTDDLTNFFRININTTGAVEIHEDSSTIFADANSMESLWLESTGGIFDGVMSSIDVEELAQLHGETRIRIGEHGFDTFNAGQLEFRSNGHVDIFEDSSTRIVGTNTAQTLDITSLGNLNDADDATINVVAHAGMEGLNINLGDTADDVFNAGSIYFESPGEFFLREDSATNIIDSKNSADQMELHSTGGITDDPDAAVNITQLARFVSESVRLGDSTDDEFNAGSISFTTTEQFFVRENSDTQIEGINSAINSIVNSTGDLTTAADATLDVVNNASFFGQSINVGNQTGDAFNFGTLTVNSPGSATITEDSDTVLVAISDVNTLTLESTGMITDGTNSQMNVTGIASLRGTQINLGDVEEDTFNAMGLTINTPGNATITEDSATILTGSNNANSLTINASGNITDSETAAINVVQRFSVNGGLINLGDFETDQLNFGSLNFNGIENVSIIADSSIDIVDTNSADSLFLTAADPTGDITDDILAETIVTVLANFTGEDVIIGDELSDCFDVPLDGLVVNATGISDVTIGC